MIRYAWLNSAYGSQARWWPCIISVVCKRSRRRINQMCFICWILLFGEVSCHFHNARSPDLMHFLRSDFRDWNVTVSLVTLSSSFPRTPAWPGIHRDIILWFSLANIPSFFYITEPWSSCLMTSQRIIVAHYGFHGVANRV